MGLEDQQEEREVLESIFPDEITDLSPTSYRIAIALDIPPLPSSTSDTDPSATPLPIPTINLTINLPETYPDTVPSLDLSLPPACSPIPLIDLATDRPSLLSSLADEATANIGMPMVFTLYSHVKDALESLVAARRADLQREKDREAVQREEEENRKFVGERVDRESFRKWRESFRREMEGNREREEEEALAGETGGGARRRTAVGKGEVKTGRQLWEEGLVGGVEDEEEEEAEEVHGGDSRKARDVGVTALKSLTIQ